MKSKILKILHMILLVIILIMIVGSLYVKLNFSSTTFEEVIFYLKNGVEEADSSTFFKALKICIPIILAVLLILYTLFYDITFGRKKIISKKNKQIYPIKPINRHRKLITIILFILSILSVAWGIRFFNYVVYINSDSDFIEKNYVDPVDTNVTFKEKRNLITIRVESLETSLFTKEQGGSWKYEVIPELYSLLEDEDSVTFYNKEKQESMNMIHGSSWTTASIVSNSTGLPFKIRISNNQYHSDNFMNGVYSLGDLLKDNGYYNEVISGARVSFGGLQEFYTKHGEYNIIDEKNLEEYGYVLDEKDKCKWGFNDKFLFDIAKDRLNELSELDMPFNLELVTIDTHFIDGFVYDYSETKYKEQYENAYATTSRLIYEFITWLKEQDYYKNTTIVIMGDHLSMQNGFFEDRGAEDDRYVYYCIINPVNKIEDTSNRIYTSLDTYPTVISSIGGEIEGNKLGLGVNLFSNEKTLAEEYTLETLDDELMKKSTFYDDYILDDDYLKKFNLKEN